MKVKKPPIDPYKKKDLPIDHTRERLKQILGTGVSKEFVEWYRQDHKGSGFTTPGLKYQGPGNPTNIGDPVNVADSFAEKHDLQYAHASYKFKTGKINQQQYENRIKKIDEEFLKNNAHNITASMNPLEQVSSLIGTVGIGVKYGAERAFGQQYPSTNPEEAYKGVRMEGGKLADKLMNNLNNNVSSRSDMSASTSKRGSNSTSSIPTKVQVVGADSTSSPPASTAQTSQVQGQIQDGMDLPGTGAPQAGGGAEDGTFMYHAPSTNFGRKISVYRKQHKVQSFGITSDGFGFTDKRAVILPTCLMEIPWHLPAFYLTPNEFGLIPEGSHVKAVKISVRYRKTTVQFGTNTTITQEAVLNQLTDVVAAEALNKTGYGSDYWPNKFENNNPMKVSGAANPVYGKRGLDYRGLVEDLYGQNNNGTNFLSYLPKVQLGMNWIPRNYFCMTTEQKASGDPGEEPATGGWPNLWNHVRQYDGDTAKNITILEMIYEPKVAPLKNPIRYRPIGIPLADNATTNNSLTIPTVGSKGTFWTPRVTRSQVDPLVGGYENNTVTDITNNPNQTSALNFDIYTPIEKSQWMRTGIWGDANSHVQPSAHVGVQPVPALNTNALIADDDATKYTTTKGYFLIDAEMIVQEHLPTVFPYESLAGPLADVPYGDQMLWADTTLRPSNAAPLVAALGQGPTQAGALKGGLFTQNTTITL